MSHFSCAICLSLFGANSSGNIVSIKCGHVFHGNCLNLWFLSQKNRLIYKSCPTCRHIVLNSHVRRLYLSESPSTNAAQAEPPITTNANLPDDEKAIANDQAMLPSRSPSNDDINDDIIEGSDDDEPNQAAVYQRSSTNSALVESSVIDRHNQSNQAAEYLLI